MLQWNHNWGAKITHFEMLVGMGDRVPDGFYDRPEILPVSAWYWTAFCALETERHIGMAAGPIPRSKVREYALEHGMDDADEFAEFWQIIARLDNEATRIRRVPVDDEENFRERVPATDVGGVKALMKNLGRKPRK